MRDSSHLPSFSSPPTYQLDEIKFSAKSQAADAELLGHSSPSEAEETRRNTLHYTVIAQSSDELQSIENAPSISMARFLTDGDLLRSIPAISIYGERGYDREHARLLYMNAAALAIWREMGKRPIVIGARYRPPQSATLAFGVPFSE